MNSATWLVSEGDQRYVAKLVSHAERSQFEAALAAADHLELHGIDAGRPYRALDGSLTAQLDGYVLALLRFVSGRALDRYDPIDQQWWGDRLGAVHLGLATFHHAGLPAWHWVRPDAQHLDDALRPRIARAVQELERLQVTDLLTFGTLHGDPYYGDFLLDEQTGRIGVVGWDSAISGPLMYDVACAVSYAGGPDRAGELLHAYVATGAVPPSEVESALPVMLRFRWAVQADSHARTTWLSS